MEIILKNTFRGFLFGLVASAAFYIVCFLIELFSFLKEYFENAAGSPGTEVSYTLADYSPLLSVWNLITVLMVAGCACGIGTIIGLIIGFCNRSDSKDKVMKHNMTVLEDGSKRQKIQFAKGIKTLAESVTDGCTENLFYMKNFVRTDYISEAENTAIMNELVKFIGYEQEIKEHIDNNKEGGR